MSFRTRTILAQLGGFVLAAVLLYLALRGVDFGAVARAFREADYRWLAPLIAVIFISLLLRAWRWQILLKALPSGARDDGPRRVPLRLAFYSLMIGYMVNYAAPRLGEVARSANLAARSQVSFSGVFGTVVVERILDVLFLCLALLSVGLLLLERTAELYTFFVAPAAALLGRIPVLALLGLAVAVSLLVLLLYRRALASARLQHLWSARVQPILVSFKDGLLTLGRSRRPGALLLSTVAIWFCYLLMAYLPLVMLGFGQTYDLSLLDAWSIMILGSVGMVVPSPGGTGSYHFITIQTLVRFFGVAQAPAASYAVFSHAAILVLYVLIGLICLLLQGSSLRSLRTATQRAQDDPAAAPVEMPPARTPQPEEPSRSA